VADEFEMHYQPFVNLETCAVTGTEALLRWRHPTRGLVAPLTFIPILEDNGMIIPLGRWILRTACATAAAWQPTDPAQVSTMAVNVSARQLEDQGLVEDVVAALSDSGLPAQALTLEITESALVDESPVLLQRLQALKALGVKIAVDDFGTGYSSQS
jgi:EAL domain-containing protein (putative c-di-GMP-specific phosphodiesterase class I)